MQIVTLDTIDQKLLNLLQEALPLVPEPFRLLGERVGLTAQETLKHLASLEERGILQEISALFAAEKLGYRATLAALRLAPERLEAAAALVSAHPGVSHSYAREHIYNLWFTLALPGHEDLRQAVADLAYCCGAESFLFLPARRRFKKGVYFDFVTGEGLSLNSDEEPSFQGGGQVALSDKEKAAICQLQEPLPWEERPFQRMAERAGLEEADLLEIAQNLLRRGVIRRYSAALSHRTAGFTANAMGCWVVPEPQVEVVGKTMAPFPEVTHCYQRPTYPDWPYSLFTMIHAARREKCQAVAEEISRATGIKDYVLLYSSKEYKKQRVRYF